MTDRTAEGGGSHAFEIVKAAVAPGEETSAPTGSGHTEPGTVMGTAGCMSPEQVLSQLPASP